MGLLHQQKHALERLTFSELIPVYGYDEHTRTFGLTHEENPAADAVMDLAAAWYGVPSAGVDRQMVSDIEELLNLEYPANTLIQVQRLATTNVDATISNYLKPKQDSLRLGVDNGLTHEQKKALMTQVNARAKFLDKGKEDPLIQNTDHLLKEEIVFVTVRIKCKRQLRETEMSKYRAIFDRVQSQLEKLHIRPKRMDPQAYIDVVGSLLRMGSDNARVTYDEQQPIRDQIVHGEDVMEVHERYARVNDNYISSAYAHAYPAKHHLRAMLPLFGDVMGSTRQINDPYLATLNIIIPDHVKAYDEYNTSRGMTKNFAERGGSMSSWFPKISYKGEQFRIMDKALAGGSGVLCKVWTSFVTFSKSAEAAEDAIQNFKTMARGFRWDFRADRFVAGQVFLQSLPLCANVDLAKDLARYQTKATAHAAHLMPIVGEWAGNSHLPTQLYITRRGSLSTINTWDSDSGYNIVVVASTGSGKSVWAQDFMLQNLATGVRCAFVDKGRSAKRTIEELSGQYFDFIEPGTYNLNPFKQVRNIDEETEQISIIFQTMADPSAELTNFQRPKLTKIIREGWEKHGTDCTVDWVAERCFEDEDRRIKDIGHMLGAYCESGQHGAWFSQGTPVTFGGNMLTGIELSGLDNKPNLQAVVLQSVLMELQRLMYLEDIEGTGKKSMTMIDEAADLLQLNGPAVFAERMARQARKYSSSVMIISQLLSDLKERISTGRAILANSAFKVLLKQRQEVIQELKTENWAGLNDYEVAMLETVHTVSGRYSEALFITPNGSGVGRLVLPRFDQLLYTTDPDEKAAIARLKGQGMSTAEAIKKLAEDQEEKDEGAGKGLDQRRVA